jgi:hypothetical protein
MLFNGLDIELIQVHGFVKGIERNSRLTGMADQP